MNKGTYLLLIKTEENINIIIKKKEVLIEKGLYCYVGSAMKNLHQRVGRHIDYKSGKYNKHWHVDNLLEKGNVIFSVIIPDGIYREERISKKMSESFKSVKNFGASDLKVDSNLFIIENRNSFFDILKEILNA
ncbi:MAG TPA: GIY-YIG nuclease family protein [Tepiditoga sp.]|nr:GIY-YIG nuclease family protein [Tepiditoga sp.]